MRRKNDIGLRETRRDLDRREIAWRDVFGTKAKGIGDPSNLQHIPCSPKLRSIVVTYSVVRSNVQQMLRALTPRRIVWLDFTKHTLSRVDNLRHGYLLHTLGQGCIPNRLEFRILLRPSKPLCHFCIGVAASTCGTNIFQHHRNYTSRACEAALTSQNIAGDLLPMSVFEHSTSDMSRRPAGKCCHSCPGAVLIATSRCPLPRGRGYCNWTVTGYTLGEWSGN